MSAEARQRVGALQSSAISYGVKTREDVGTMLDRDKAALLTHIAELEAEVERLRALVAECRPFVALQDWKPLLARIDATRPQEDCNGPA